MKPKPNSEYTELRRAVLDWIKAEYAFRYGAHAFQSPTDKLYLEAEDALRKIVTGKRRLPNAAKAIFPKFVARHDKMTADIRAKQDVKRKVTTPPVTKKKKKNRDRSLFD